MLIAACIFRAIALLALNLVTIFVQLLTIALRCWKLTFVVLGVVVILNWEAVSTFVYNFFNC